MTSSLRRGRPLWPPLALCAALLAPRAGAAQSFAPQPQLYLLSVDASDSRAVWAQPAALVRRQEASVALFGTMKQDGESGLTQWGVNLASRGLGLAYQRYPGTNGASVTTLSLGYAFGGERLALGFTQNWFRGPTTSSRGVDIGVRATVAPPLELSFVARDIGTPSILTQIVRPTLVPAAALNVLGGRIRLSGEWELVARDRGTSAVRGALSVALPANLQLMAAGDFSGSLEYRSLAVSLNWSGLRQVRATTFYQDNTGGADPIGAWVALVQSLVRPRRGIGGI